MPSSDTYFKPGNQAWRNRKAISQDFKDGLDKALPEALKAVIELMKNSPSEKIRLEAAREIFNRCLGRPGVSVSVDHRSNPVDTEAIQKALASTARAVALEYDAESGATRLMLGPENKM